LTRKEELLLEIMLFGLDTVCDEVITPTQSMTACSTTKQPARAARSPTSATRKRGHEIANIALAGVQAPNATKARVTPLPRPARRPSAKRR
jgi:hypothetical protein